MSKRIALLITGGTIGMKTETSSSKLPSTPVDYAQILEHLPAELPPPELHQHLLCYKDSSAIDAADWQLIAKEINKQLPKYDGFIVTHGTDTMAYSASAVAYWFGLPLPKPIVFTGSCRTPDLPHTDAWSNLADAVVVACGNLREVAIVFCGKVLRACQSTKIAALDDDIFSAPEQGVLAKLSRQPGNPLEFSQPLPHSGVRDKPLNFSQRLIMLESVPNFNSQTLDALAGDSNWSLALIQGLGNGNLPAEFLGFTHKAIKHGKHVVIRPATAGGSAYPPLQQALAAGALLAKGYSLSALWVKLCWIVGQLEEQKGARLTYRQRQDIIQQQLQTNFIGEILL